jgi:hypothetical protein
MVKLIVTSIVVTTQEKALAADPYIHYHPKKIVNFRVFL